ncbi:MAG: HD-GYP domain-containing protein [Treponema sp.]|nr:HD-GYP domain-containing protein [Treponema sp.]
MVNVALNTLTENVSFTDDLMLDSNLLVLPKGCPVTEDLLSALREWDFRSFYSEGSMSLSGVSDESENSVDISEEEEILENKPSVKIGENVKKALETSLHSRLDGSDKTRMNMVQQVYDEYMNYIEQVFTHYATHNTIDLQELSETVTDLCVFIKDNKRFMLRINPTERTTNKNFLVIHTMRTTVLAIAIALQMHTMDMTKIVELGVTSILHEIGMLRLPPQIYMTDKKLTPGEKLQIYKHPLFGYGIVKELGFPTTIQLGVLEHHEKENGTGYPRKLTGEKISTIAKIISVACSYEAITSPRSYKDEKSNFDAILELLKNENHPYDDVIIKSLLYTVSLYPIGSFVFMTNRKIGVVIDTNPENPKFPVVQLLTVKDEKGEPVIIQTGKSDIKIARILSRREQEDILNFVEGKTNKAASPETEDDESLEELEELDDDFEESSVSTPVNSRSAEMENLHKAEKSNQNPLNSHNGSVAQTKPAPKPKTQPENKGDGMEDIDISIFS